MFRCQSCNENSNLKTEKIILSKKERLYWNIIVIDEFKNKKYLVYSEKKQEIIEQLKSEGKIVIGEYVTKGWEIGEEITVCKKCFKEKEVK